MSPASPYFRNYDPSAGGSYGHDERGKSALRHAGATVHSVQYGGMQQGYGVNGAVMTVGGSVAGLPVRGGSSTQADARNPFATASVPPFSGPGACDAGAMQGVTSPVIMQMQIQPQQPQQSFSIPHEVECLKDLLAIVNELDRPTQISIRDSLRRLAVSADLRKKAVRTTGKGKSGGGAHRANEMTNLIDRSVAQLLYYNKNTHEMQAGHDVGGVSGVSVGAGLGKFSPDFGMSEPRR